MSVTMRDIAALVGVSQATVSYVLNAHPKARISPATRQRILEAAAQLNYRPNAMARAMASGRARTIGVYQSHVSETPLSGMWTAAVMRGISEVLRTREFHLLLYGYHVEAEPPLAVFLDGSVDGLILLAPHLEDRLPQSLAEAGFPTAIVGGRAIPGPAIITVDADNTTGARLATEHLIRLGHRRIAHLHGSSDVPNAVDRLNGYQAALRAHRLPVRSETLVYSGFALEGGYEAACTVLRRTPRPTALFVTNDLAALGALQACQDSNLRVPEDVAVVGYDDAPICQFARPLLTTMRQPAQEMGRGAAEMLLALAEGHSLPEPYRGFTAELVVRESCGGLTHAALQESMSSRSEKVPA
jgi:LacI family transcriptional regulator